MLYILASILSSTIILILFRWMGRSTATTRHAILISYLASTMAGAVLFNVQWTLQSFSWFWPAAIEGVCFYVVFRMIALTTQTTGITVAGIATKMSVVIPTLIGITFLGESVSALKAFGLLAGFTSVILAAGTRLSVAAWALPVAVFLATGLIDASFKLFQIWGLTEQQFPEFVITIFGFAFIAAISHHLLLPDRQINRSSILAGIGLGLANLGTVYFLLKALAQPGWESSIVYPLNNFGIVLASAVTAIVLFKERPATSTKISLVFAISSITLLYLAS